MEPTFIYLSPKPQFFPVPETPPYFYCVWAGETAAQRRHQATPKLRHCDSKDQGIPPKAGKRHEPGQMETCFLVAPQIHGLHSRFPPSPRVLRWISSLKTPKISKLLDFLILIHFPFLSALADLVTSPPAISQFYQFTITCKVTPLLHLILAELIFTLF